MINLDVSVTKSSLDWFKQSLLDELQARKYGGVAVLGQLDSWTRENLDISYSDVIAADVNQLREIKNQLDQLLEIGVDTRSDLILQLKRAYVRFASTRLKIGANSNKISAFDYIERFNGITCPYCNLSVIDNNLVKRKRTSQIDHFYSQSEYPLLSMSFYNLVPACSICNHSKLDSNLEVSPHDSTNIADRSQFSMIPSMSRSQGEELCYLVKCAFDRSMSVNERVFGILGLYNAPGRQGDYQSLAGIMSAFPREKFRETEIEHPRLILSNSLSFEQLFNLRVRPNEFIKSPMSKMKYDVLKEPYNLP